MLKIVKELTKVPAFQQLRAPKKLGKNILELFAKLAQMMKWGLLKEQM